VTTSAHHHVAVRVADIERGAQFYIDALGARWLALPFELEGPEIADLWGGHEGLKVKICLLGFDEGGIELFQFVSPQHGTGPGDPAADRIMHWGMQVDDVRGTLARVEEHGGSAVHEVLNWGGKDIVYCRDPDGNIFELVSTPFEENVRLTLEVMPDATPPA
jgi:catechol 2,3-dioxygenase-like lactoylglutathione lyase family enzyme